MTSWFENKRLLAKPLSWVQLCLCLAQRPSDLVRRWCPCGNGIAALIHSPFIIVSSVLPRSRTLSCKVKASPKALRASNGRLKLASYIRYGVVANITASHAIAQGLIPCIGMFWGMQGLYCLVFVLLYVLARNPRLGLPELCLTTHYIALDHLGDH